MAEAMIEFQNVTKQYQGGQAAVDGLTMSIDKGAITVFVGPSGCGKTTSLRMINRMVEPTSRRCRQRSCGGPWATSCSRPV
jgi:osmoprotectant transport system ATP-binding protein